MNDQFIRTRMLLGAPAMERLARSHVAVLGLGGVGGWCAEALCRSGVGELTLADQDTVSVSNINRQCAALHSTVGMEKARATALRLKDIAPDCALHPLAVRYEADTREEFFAGRYDYIVDAIDLVSCKLDLIETAHRRAVPIISALGTGNKRDAQLLRIADISETEGCPLARVVRKELRKRGVPHHKVVFSPEPARSAEEGDEAPPPGRRSIPASAMWVPAAAGLLLAQAVILDLTDGPGDAPTPA
ncbi:MAG: tRNA threonylcarbamoyladenosine dehydratase [Clostridiales bacterium]|nr:tRNA threonylcarbamoyladenosine dehydratase [Clostridiales bacterium]